MRFYSNRGPFLGALLWGTVIFMFSSTIYLLVQQVSLQKTIIPLLLWVILSGFIIWLWFGTYYEVGEKDLKIVAGPIRSKVEINKITSIKRTRNPLSSPALSTDRLEVKYGRWGFVLISPKNEDEFCELLQQQNANIVVNLQRK